MSRSICLMNCRCGMKCIQPIPDDCELLVSTEIKGKSGALRMESTRDMHQKFFIVAIEEEISKRSHLVVGSPAYPGKLVYRSMIVPVHHCEKCKTRMWPHAEIDEPDSVFYVCDKCGHEYHPKKMPNHYDEYEKNKKEEESK